MNIPHAKNRTHRDMKTVVQYKTFGERPPEETVDRSAVSTTSK
jgi:hypothetical protein